MRPPKGREPLRLDRAETHAQADGDVVAWILSSYATSPTSMLVSLSMENRKSFRDRTVFTTVSEHIGQDPLAEPPADGEPAMAVASRGDHAAAAVGVAPEASPPPHPDEDHWRSHRLPGVKRLGIKTFPVTAIFGANAPGDGNLFKTLSFVQECIVSDPGCEEGLCGADPFLLEPDACKRPIRFCVRLLSKEQPCERGFSVRDGVVTEERLVSCSKTGELLLFGHKGAEFDFGKSQPNRERFEEAAKAAPPDRSFLNRARPWAPATAVACANGAAGCLCWPRLSAPGPKLVLEDPVAFSPFGQMAPRLDTDLSRFELSVAPLSKLSLPPAVRRALEAPVGEDACRDLTARCSDLGFDFVTRRNGHLLPKHPDPYRLGKGREEIGLDLGQGSDGTLHMVSFLPALGDDQVESGTSGV